MSSFDNVYNRLQSLNEARKSPVEALVPGAVGVTKQMRSAGLSSAPLDTIRFIRELLYNLDVITDEDLNFVKSGKGFTGKKQAMLKVLQDNQDAINAKSDEIAQTIENTLDNFISGMGANRSREEKYAAQAAAQELAAQARAVKSGKEMDDALADVISDEKLIIKASLAKVIQQLEDLPGGEDISPDVLDEIKRFAPKINNINQLESFVKQLSALEEYQIPAAYLSSTVKAIKGGMEDIEMEDQEDPDFDAAKADLDKDGEIEEIGGETYTTTDSNGNKQFIDVDEDGNKFYFSDREMTIYHREDGPAIEWANGNKSWFLNDEFLTEEEFNDRKKSGGNITEKRTTAVYLSELINEDNEEGGGKTYTATDSNGNKQYIRVNERGDKHYFSDPEMKIRHREDGPAIEPARRTGTKYWIIDNKFHREDGPAIDGNVVKEWYLNGKRHREDGPAVEFYNGDRAWYLNGEELREKEFNARMKTGGNITEKRTTSVYLSELINEDNEEGGGKTYTATDSNGNKQYIRVDERGYNNYYSDPEMTILHREDGPAVEDRDGNKWWFLNGKRHREDGPAVEWTNGYKAWWLNDKRHREDGPAIEWHDGNKTWYLNGKRLTEDEFNVRKRSGGNITEQHKAIAIPRSRIDENGNTTPAHPHIVEHVEDEIEEVYTSMYLTEQKSQDSLPKRKVENNISFKERYKPKTYWQLEELRRYGL